MINHTAKALGAASGSTLKKIIINGGRFHVYDKCFTFFSNFMQKKRRRRKLRKVSVSLQFIILLYKIQKAICHFK